MTPPYIWCVQLTTKKVMRFLYQTNWPHVRFHRPLQCFCSSFKEKESNGRLPASGAPPQGGAFISETSRALWLLLKTTKAWQKLPNSCWHLRVQQMNKSRMHTVAEFGTMNECRCVPSFAALLGKLALWGADTCIVSPACKSVWTGMSPTLL